MVGAGSIENVFSPWVMRAAWNKVQRWYASGELYDPAEYLAWQADPWRYLASLASELAAGTYEPQVFPVIPYPKKGDFTRHYVMPSVRDQVAFLAYLVLLGPFFEARMPNVSFGNRLFRPRINAGNRWYRAPFSLNQSQVYDPFSSGYGLFRRLLQWITNDAVLDPEDNDEDNRQRRMEEPRWLPPYFKPSGDTQRLAFARLDLSLAYPSVNRESLAQRMVQLMSQSTLQLSPAWGQPDFPFLKERQPENGENSQTERSPFIHGWLEAPRVIDGGYTIEGQPWQWIAENDQLREELATRLGELVKKIQYAPWELPEWRGRAVSDLALQRRLAPAKANRQRLEKFDVHGQWPIECHVTDEYLSQNDFGLPTGLAISGLLLNVSLTSVDLAMCALYERAPSTGKVGYLRFVDDIVCFGSNAADLGDALKQLRERLRTASENFSINIDKAKPESVGDFLRKLKDPKKKSEDPILVLRANDYLTRANAQKFTTALVQQMSDAAEETLEESFGALGVDRLERLLELASRNDEDWEVGADARLSFSVNKMATAAWPSEPVWEEGRSTSPVAYRKRVMLNAERALRNHPWRFKLWKPLLIIALRAAKDGNQQLGSDWLEKQVVPLIAWRSRSTNQSASTWEHDDSGALRSEVKARRLEHRRLRVSFHRAWFWRQWATCVRALQKVADGSVGQSDFNTWTQHFDQDEARRALSWFADPARWATVLYRATEKGYWPSGKPFLWWWEAECLRDALLSCVTPSTALLCSLGNPRPHLLRLPSLNSAELLSRLPDTTELTGIRMALQNVLTYPGGVFPTKPKVVAQKLAVLWVTRCHSMKDGLQEVVSDKNAQYFLPKSGQDTLEWAAIARMSLWGGWTALAKLRISATPPMHGNSTWGKFILLDTYAQVRRLLNAHGHTVRWRTFANWFAATQLVTLPTEQARSKRSLLEAMYRLDQRSAPPDALVPAIELESHVAYSLADEAQSIKAGAFASPDTVVLKRKAFGLLLAARKTHVLAGTAAAARDDLHEVVIQQLTGLMSSASGQHIQQVQRLTNGVRAPHPLYLFPEVVLGLPAEPAARWRAALLFLWLLSGGEHLLDQLYRVAPWHPPLYDRDDLRSNLLLTDPMWKFIETGLGSYSLTSSTWSYPDATVIPPHPGHADVEWLIKMRDVYFGKSSREWGVAPTEKIADKAASEERAKQLHYLKVRLVQAKAQPDPNITAWAATMSEVSYAYHRGSFDSISTELADRLREARAHARVRNSTADHMLILPEWFTPDQYIGKLKQFVRETGIALLTGILVRELPRAVPGVPALKTRGWRLLVNEAALMLPSQSPEVEEHSDGMRLPLRVHVFRIRKPYPNANEIALAEFLQQEAGQRGEQSRWSFVPGLHWYRWSYGSWGSFSVAICSDILDTFIWDWLRGRIQHLFVPSWNKDIELFDQMTWARGYELYANVASVNHGSAGGSLAWTPMHNHAKEIFRVHGPEQGLAVTVNLPITQLIQAQTTQLRKSIDELRQGWQKSPKPPAAKFKTPPPNYRKK